MPDQYMLYDKLAAYGLDGERNGLAGGGADSLMPHVRGVLSALDARAVVTFVRRLRRHGFPTTRSDPEWAC